MSGTLAPALQRGVMVWRMLVDQGPARLEDLARHSGWPKSSLLRLLDTLEELGLVVRESTAGGYRAVMRPVSIEEPPVRRERVLTRLAAETGQAAEWWQPTEAGMLLISRRDPPQGEVAVRAQEGFVRPWNEELEAVAVLGLAYLAPSRRGYRGMWAQCGHGESTALTVAEVRTRVAAAHDSGTAVDRWCNSNGVQRIAALVRADGVPSAVLALARVVTAGADDDPTPLLAGVARAAAECSI